MPAPVFTVDAPLIYHPAYGPRHRARDFWRRSYWAGADYVSGKDANGNEILPQHPRETNEKYLLRKAMSITRRYCRFVINRYNDHANRMGAKRKNGTGAGTYGTLVDDATGSGIPLPTLMRKAMRKAQIEAESYLLADFNEAGVYLSAGEEAAAGKRGILRLVSADQVIWWSDWQGQVDSAVILFCDRDGNDFAWYVTPTSTQRINLRRNEEKDLIVIGFEEQTPHTFGGCPLVRLAPEWEEDDHESKESALDYFDSQAAPLADSQKRLLNIETWHTEELQGATFTTTVFLGVDPAQISNGGVEVGAGKAIALPGGTGGAPSVDKIGADPAQADSVRTALDREVKELFRAAGLSPGNPTESAQPESGVAKAFAFNEVETRLAALADAAQMAENLVVKRLSNGANFPYPGDADWPDKFDSPNLAAELEYVIRLVTAPLPPILKAEQIKKFADEAFVLKGEEQKALDDQLGLDSAQSFVDTQNPFLTAGKTDATPRLGMGIDANASKVQDTALNGAQVTALQAIIQSVADNQLPGLAAELMIHAAFPNMDDATVKKMVASADKFVPKKETPPAVTVAAGSGAPPFAKF